jgi:hypothetical protein
VERVSARHPFCEIHALLHFSLQASCACTR